MRYNAYYTAENKTFTLEVSPAEDGEIDGEFIARFMGVVSLLCPTDVVRAVAERMVELMGATLPNG